MRNISFKQKLFSRRIFFILIGKLFLTSILLLRLLYLQIFKFNQFKTKSDSNRIKSYILPPLRGEIFDINGKILATNTIYYRILLNQEHTSNINDTLKKIASILEIDPKDLLYNNLKTKRKSSNLYILIHENLTWSEVAKIEVNITQLPGVTIEEAQRRFYPYDKFTAQLIGYVAAVNEKELIKSNNALLTHPDFKIGKTGIEKYFENFLRGKAGLQHVETDAYGYKISNLELPSSRTAIAGENLQLTIDIELQKYTHQLIKDKLASVSLIDVTNGNILVLASNPTFNSNDFIVGISNEDWQNLVNDPGKPLQNKAISNNYPPGSIFKIIVALAALEDGFNPKQKYNCNGKVKLGRRYYHCWKEEGHGDMDLVDALKHSCNVYFYQMSREIGIAKIAKMANKFGLGNIINLPLLEQNKGFIPTKEWKRKVIKEHWVIGDTFNSAIGQGYVQVTNIQLANLISKIASGLNIQPHIILNNYTKNTDFSKLDINPNHLEIIRNGLFKVVNEKNGTAYYNRIKTNKYKMSGKTGTAQVVSLEYTKDLEQNEIDFEKRNHGLFIGYAPYTKPRFAVSIIVEHGGSGSGSAAPIARKLLYKAQKIYDI